MSSVTRAKVVLAIIGLGLFGVGARFEYPALRWAGIGLVLVAWLLRFAPKDRAGDSAGPQD